MNNVVKTLVATSLLSLNLFAAVAAVAPVTAASVTVAATSATRAGTAAFAGPAASTPGTHAAFAETASTKSATSSSATTASGTAVSAGPAAASATRAATHAAVSPSRRDTVKVLAIGNSFSTDALQRHLHDIAVADGQAMVIGNMYIGGCKLEKHWDCASNDRPAYRYGKQEADGGRISRPGTTLLEGIVDEDWDVITMQQGGGLYGIEESYQPYLSLLKAYVLEHATNPDVKLAMHQIWALPEENATNRYCVRLYGSVEKMYEANVAAARHFQESEGMAFVIPTGTAIQNLRLTPAARSIYRDAHHLSYTLGRYTAALTWYESLTGHDVRGNGYEPPYISPHRREVAQKCAHAAVQCPDRTTPGIWDEPAVISLEEDVPAYVLPDPLLTASGEKVESVRQWESVRRPELLELFTKEMFGRAPEPSPKQYYELQYVDSTALGGLATRREVNVYFTESRDAFLTMLIYTPNDAAGPVPLFLGMNFKGNWSVSDEEGIIMAPMGTDRRHMILENHERGVSKDAWPLEMILRAGYGVATYYRGDTCPDLDTDFNTPLHCAFNPDGKWKHPEADEWGCIAAWAWGLSRCMDYLETDERVDASRVAVFGHSRLGKTALWAGATDPRFALVISNCSGCGGAAISRRHFGETLEAVNGTMAHWFCDNFKKYDADEAAMPFDQHELLALVAPRPLYVASATLDGWADPHGEFISACEASRVYDLYGVKGLVGVDGKAVTATARRLAAKGSRRGRMTAGDRGSGAPGAGDRSAANGGSGASGAGDCSAANGGSGASAHGTGVRSDVSGASGASGAFGARWRPGFLGAAAAANGCAGRIVTGTTLVGVESSGAMSPDAAASMPAGAAGASAVPSAGEAAGTGAGEAAASMPAGAAGASAWTDAGEAAAVLSRGVMAGATRAEREIEALKYAAMPEPDQPLLDGAIAYHIRTGKHAITAYDWQQYIKFADRFLK